MESVDPPPLAALPRRRRSLARLGGLHDRRAASLSPRHRLAKEHPPPRRPRVDRDELRCAICFDLLSFPVTLPCGHNFDRGCLLTAWLHEPTAPSAVDANAAAAHACPLCRRRPVATQHDLQVNLLLKKLIAAQFPLEMDLLERDEFKCHAATASASSATTIAPPSPPVESRRRRTWRTAASVFSVWLASVTEPPGFVLAVLLLLSLLALAVTPQQMLTNASTLPSLFEAMDHVLNAFLLLVREIGARTDELDVVAWRVLQAFTFVL